MTLALRCVAKIGGSLIVCLYPANTQRDDGIGQTSSGSVTITVVIPGPVTIVASGEGDGSGEGVIYEPE